ncbi:hypothetical protein, partial [Novacetimonas hansenii]|uniref:hypothetical protein n=1 Tax=Novacetimonas hansenii TaxID=436 RepID=UPI0039EB653D
MNWSHRTKRRNLSCMNKRLFPTLFTLLMAGSSLLSTPGWTAPPARQAPATPIQPTAEAPVRTT